MSNSIIPSKTANSIHVMKMCQAFGDNGHEVVLLAPDLKEEGEKNITDVYSYYGVKETFRIRKFKSFGFRGQSILQLFYIFNILSKESPDLVYGRFAAGCAVASLMRYKTILEIHSPIWETGIINRLSFWVLSQNLKYFKKIILISDGLKDAYNNKNIIDMKKIKVAHDAADCVADFSKKAKLKGVNTNLEIGYIGHLYKGRGIDLIIDMADQLPQHNFHVVGGMSRDVEYWRSVLKIRDVKNVYFYGYVPPAETVKYRNSFDILLAPYAKSVSVYGSNKSTSSYMSPLKIFEYMAHRKPIIVSDLPVLREVFSDSSAIFASPEDLSSWVSSVSRLECAGLRARISENAYNRFIENYTWNIRAEKVLG